MPEAIPHSAPIAALAAGLAEGRWTSEALVEAYLARIDRLDGLFGSIRGLVPDCREQARASDRRRAGAGPRGPLEGIPVVVKDNIDVAGTPTTGGALALEHSVPARDAPLIARLREAGAVMMAKTNLSELANFLTEAMPSGYSSLGGQVLNPYDTSVTPSGSSSGSATAVALGLCAAAVGTETDGSITSPSERQSLVGVKPTVGLVSRTGVLPISPSQDTPGPMARSVADAAALLAAMAGPDPADPATAGSAAATEALRTLRLEPGALRGARIGVIRELSEDEEEDRANRESCHHSALSALAAAGAVVRDVHLPAVPRGWPSSDDELAVLHHEFAPAVDAYLAALDGDPPRRSLAEIAEWNRAHAREALKFGQVHVDRALAIDHAAQDAAYRDARRRSVESTTGALEDALGDELEVLVFPGAMGQTLAAQAGWPSLVVPAGYGASHRRPIGVLFIGRPWSEARLLSLATAFEVAHPVRKPPWEVNPAAFRRLGTG